MSQRATPTASPAATAEASASELADSPSSSVRIVAWSAFQPIVPPSTPASSSSAEDCCVICARSAKCAHASFNVDGKACYMKDASAQPVPWDPAKKGSDLIRF